MSLNLLEAHTHCFNVFLKGNDLVPKMQFKSIRILSDILIYKRMVYSGHQLLSANNPHKYIQRLEDLRYLPLNESIKNAKRSA